MKSIPVAAKVGTAGVLGGGGIAGTGLLIHNQLQKTSKEPEYKLEGLDLELVNDSEAVLGVDSGTEFSIGETNQTNQATLKIKVTAAKAESKAINGKWTCTITGIAKNSDGTPIALTNTPNGNFDKKDQTGKFTEKLGKDNGKKTTQNGFVKSCARNRTETQKQSDGTLTSEIKVALEEITKSGSPTTKQYVFSTDFINKLFSGDWVNKS